KRDWSSDVCSSDLYLFIVENLVTMYAQTPQANTYIRSTFDALTGVTNAFCDALRVVSQLPIASSLTQGDASNTSIVVREGERDGALRYIRDWLSTLDVEDILICDAYFGCDELFLIQLVMQI